MIDPEAAYVLANRLLDEPGSDPDDDLRTLSRQLLRQRDWVAALSASLHDCLCELSPLMQAYRAEHEAAICGRARSLLAALSAFPLASAPVGQGEWRGIESAPRDGTPILAWGPHGHDQMVVCYGDDWPYGEDRTIPGWSTLDGPIYGEVFTHWQPLPAPPPTARERR